jgi:uncharacterized membrane protein YkoI
MDRKLRWVAGTTLALAIIGGATGLAMASSSDDRTPNGTGLTQTDAGSSVDDTGVGESEAGGDEALTGSDLDRATAAALQHTGGGTVIEAEHGDGGAAYGVEVRRADGSVVEVALDGNFRVVGQESDDG